MMILKGKISPSFCRTTCYLGYSRDEKMSKSDPSSSIYMEDGEADVNVKIKKAYCPPKVVEGNPCLEYIKYIVFPWFGSFEVVRQEDNSGNKAFASIEELIADYESGALHPADVKPALAKAINQILQPVRNHFKNNSEARKLLKTVKVVDTIKELPGIAQCLLYLLNISVAELFTAILALFLNQTLPTI